MTRRSFRFAIVCLLPGCLIAALARPAAGLTVGTVGDVTNAVIEGARGVSADEIRGALSRDAAIAVACAPSAPLTNYLNTVQRQLLAGYLDAGYPQAKVRADVEAGGAHLQLRIDEGPRLTWSTIRIIGGKLTDKARLRNALTTPDNGQSPIKMDGPNTLLVPTYKPNDPLAPQGSIAFEAGKPARLTLSKIKNTVSYELVRQGLFWADPKVSFEHQDNGTASLVIDLNNEGPRAKLREVHVIGAKTNTPEQIIAFTGLHRGMTVDLPVLLAVRQKLWDSGRFLRHDLKADVAGSHRGEIDLTIDLFEHPDAPPLDQPIDANLTPAERAAMKLRVAADELAAGNVDYTAEIHFSGQRITAILQPRRGIIVEYRRPIGPTTRPTTAQMNPPVDLGLFMTSGKIGFWSETTGHRFVGNAALPVSIEMNFAPDPEKNFERVKFKLGAGFKLNGDAGVKFGAVMAPVCFFDLVKPHRDKSASTTQPASGSKITAEFHGDLAVVKLGDFVFRLNASTGQLLDFASNNALSKDTLRVKRDVGALDRELSRLESEHTPNDFDREHPVTSFAKFYLNVSNAMPKLGSDAVLWNNRATPVLLKLLAAGTLQPLDNYLRDAASDDAGEFAIPWDNSVLSSGGMALMRIYLPYVDAVFPRATWPWTLAHESLLFASGGAPEADGELRRTMGGGETGPIGCLAVAEVLQPVNPNTARLAAKVGLERSSDADFQKDLHVLLDNQQPSAQVITNLLTAVSNLNDDEATQLASVLPTGGADAIAYLRTTAKNHPGEPLVKALRANTAEWWEKGLRPMIDPMLKRIAG